MPDRHYTEARLAALYDRQHPPEKRRDYAFYLPMILAAESVLDVGCGTGSLLRMVRDAGHDGRLVGLDPAEGMLAQARRRSDADWMLGDLSTVAFDSEFDLVVMTGHAFQVLLTDEQMHDVLASVRRALTDAGRFAFETRNPAARAWERWTPAHGMDFTAAGGTPVRWEADVELPVSGDLVRFRTRYATPRWQHPYESDSTLRFTDAATLDRFLARAGLAVEDRYGDWDRSPPTDASPEIITIARRTPVDHRGPSSPILPA